MQPRGHHFRSEHEQTQDQQQPRDPRNQWRRWLWQRVQKGESPGTPRFLVLEHCIKVDNLALTERREAHVVQYGGENTIKCMIKIIRRIGKRTVVCKVKKQGPREERKEETELNKADRDKFYEDWKVMWKPTLPEEGKMTPTMLIVSTVEPFNIQYPEGEDSIGDVSETSIEDEVEPSQLHTSARKEEPSKKRSTHTTKKAKYKTVPKVSESSQSLRDGFSPKSSQSHPSENPVKDSLHPMRKALSEPYPTDRQSSDQKVSSKFKNKLSVQPPSAQEVMPKMSMSSKKQKNGKQTSSHPKQISNKSRTAPPSKSAIPKSIAARPSSQSARSPSHSARPPSHSVRPPSHSVRPPSHSASPPSQSAKPPSHSTRPPCKLSTPLSKSSKSHHSKPSTTIPRTKMSSKRPILDKDKETVTEEVRETPQENSPKSSKHSSKPEKKPQDQFADLQRLIREQIAHSNEELIKYFTQTLRQNEEKHERRLSKLERAIHSEFEHVMHEPSRYPASNNGAGHSPHEPTKHMTSKKSFSSHLDKTNNVRQSSRRSEQIESCKREKSHLSVQSEQSHHSQRSEQKSLGKPEKSKTPAQLSSQTHRQVLGNDILSRSLKPQGILNDPDWVTNFTGAKETKSTSQQNDIYDPLSGLRPDKKSATLSRPSQINQQNCASPELKKTDNAIFTQSLGKDYSSDREKAQSPEMAKTSQTTDPNPQTDKTDLKNIIKSQSGILSQDGQENVQATSNSDQKRRKSGPSCICQRYRLFGPSHACPHRNLPELSGDSQVAEYVGLPPRLSYRTGPGQKDGKFAWLFEPPKRSSSTSDIRSNRQGKSRSKKSTGTENQGLQSSQGERSTPYQTVKSIHSSKHLSKKNNETSQTRTNLTTFIGGYESRERDGASLPVDPSKEKEKFNNRTFTDFTGA